MLRLRRDTGNDDYKKEAALKKLIYEIKKAYLVELIENGDNYRFQRVNSNVSSPNKAPQQIYNQPQDNSYLPTKEDFESAYRTLTRPGETISIDSVLDQMEINAKKEGHVLKDNWRIITERNFEIWSKKQ